MEVDVMTTQGDWKLAGGRKWGLARHDHPGTPPPTRLHSVYFSSGSYPRCQVPSILVPSVILTYDAPSAATTTTTF